MLDSFQNLVFDYASFEKKLKHYFSDTCPIRATVALSKDGIDVANGCNKSIFVKIDFREDVQTNVGNVIKECEKYLCPKMRDEVEEELAIAESVIKDFLLLGYSMEQILSKKVKSKMYGRSYTITRFNFRRSTVDYKEGDGTTFRVYLKKPLLMCREKIFELSEKGEDRQKDLYKYIIENSKKVEELPA